MDNGEGRAALEQEIERLRQALASRDEPPPKRRGGGVGDLKSIHQIPTSVNKGVRSLPDADDRYYLDLFRLQKERERLTREIDWLRSRSRRIDQRLADIASEMAHKQQMASQLEALATGQAAPKGEGPSSPQPGNDQPSPWRQKPIHY